MSQSSSKIAGFAAAAAIAPLTLVLGIGLGSASGSASADLSLNGSPCTATASPTVSPTPSTKPGAQSTPTPRPTDCLETIPPTSGLGNTILGYAQKWLGTPYQFGGGNYTGPTVGFNSNGSGRPGWDCSGLTMYAVYQATRGRVQLPHFAASQMHDKHVRLVTYAQLQPGDLVFWAGSNGTRTSPGHVGIYAGNQRFLNAPFTGANVRFDSMAPGTHRYSTFIAGARVIA